MVRERGEGEVVRQVAVMCGNVGYRVLGLLACVSPCEAHPTRCLYQGDRRMLEIGP